MGSTFSPIRAKSSIGSRLGLFALGFLLAGLGVTFCWLLWMGYERSAATREWESTPCIVVSSLVEEGPYQTPQDRRYYARVTYRYTFEGREYRSMKITQRDGGSRSREEIEEQLARYPIGEEIVCFVNPEDPTEAILKHSTRAAGYSIWFPGLFVIGGLGMMLRAIVQR